MAKKAKHVLLIEDDKDTAQLLRLRLAKEISFPFELDGVDTLDAGLKRLALGNIDVVVLDLGLPDSRGIETFNKLHALAPQTPTVILSGSDDFELALEAIRCGAQDYLIKGKVDGNMLPRILRYAIERQEIQTKLAATTQDLQAANTRLAMLTLLDPLTELYNRRGLQHIFSREIHLSRREGTNPIVILIDLDDFKGINDSLGHAVGDVILKEIAGRIKSSLRSTDYAGRIGGDEFMILLPETREAEGLHIAERVRLAISGDSIMLPSGPARVTGSLGMVIASRDIPSVDELVSQTQLALHKSKQSGKNRISFDDPTRNGDGVPSEIFTKLRAGNSLRTVMQPIFNLYSGKECGYEFLSRSTIQGFEMPDHFFRFCLEHNLLTLVDHQCLKACVTASQPLAPHLVRHINLFPSTLIGIPAEDLVAAFPKDLPKGAFCVEISEQQIIGDPSYLIPVVLALKQAGICVAIDDVGFGRSCLESLILLEPDIVKIDKKFVIGLSRNQGQSRSLKRLLNVAESIDSKTIAEGIETAEDLAVLKQLGVKYGQGYFLGRPIDAPVAVTSSGQK